MYGPAFGIAEDAATGSAAAAIAGAAALRAGSSLKLDIRQGVKMGRPSLIRTSATVEGGQLRANRGRRRLRLRRARADRGARPFPGEALGLELRPVADPAAVA